MNVLYIQVFSPPPHPHPTLPLPPLRNEKAPPTLPRHFILLPLFYGDMSPDLLTFATPTFLFFFIVLVVVGVRTQILDIFEVD